MFRHEAYTSLRLLPCFQSWVKIKFHIAHISSVSAGQGKKPKENQMQFSDAAQYSDHSAAEIALGFIRLGILRQRRKLFLPLPFFSPNSYLSVRPLQFLHFKGKI